MQTEQTTNASDPIKLNNLLCFAVLAASTSFKCMPRDFELLMSHREKKEVNRINCQILRQTESCCWVNETGWYTIKCRLQIHLCHKAGVAGSIPRVSKIGNLPLCPLSQYFWDYWSKLLQLSEKVTDQKIGYWQGVFVSTHISELLTHMYCSASFLWSGAPQGCITWCGARLWICRGDTPEGGDVPEEFVKIFQHVTPSTTLPGVDHTSRTPLSKPLTLVQFMLPLRILGGSSAFCLSMFLPCLLLHTDDALGGCSIYSPTQHKMQWY